MYLKRLELHGFKSFPEKISLDFKKGITCVVGPNGSGKSNISDSIRWVLGEQSARSLRGAKMEDVIFAGTQNRKPLGFGQVSIVIDNQDNRIPIDFSEIIICRRVYRSGESEFFINNTPCRLKDIHELLMDTGIGREGYSIIGQGRIDEILNAKSEDRRFFFEEAAGIIKFRSRRDESLNRLEKERQNLIRVGDILSELESKLDPLEQQSDTAKRYLELIEEQKLIKVNIFLAEVDKTERELHELSDKVVYINEQLDNENKIKQMFIEDISNYKSKLSDVDEKYKFCQNNLIELNKNLSQKQNDIKLIEEKNIYTGKEISTLEREKQTSLDNINASLEHTESLKNAIEGLNQSLNAENAILLKKQQDFDSLNMSMSKKESEIENYNTEIFEGYKNISDIKSHLNKVKNNFESLLKRKEELAKETDDNDLKTNTLQEVVLKTDFELLRTRDIYEKLREEVDSLNNSRSEYQERFEQETKNYNSVTRDLNDKLSRLGIMKELKEDFEGYYNSTKAVLKQKKINPRFSGIHGALGELIEVPPEYETAIEIALGGYIQNIVTDTQDDAKAAIEYLKATKQGRATFLPISSVKGRKNDYASIKEQGVIELAQNLIKYSEVYKNIINFTLGSVIVCDNLDNAVALSRKYNNTLKIVTLEGDLLNPGGAMTGGSIAKRTANIFGRAREIKELTQRIAEMEILQKSSMLACTECTSYLEDLKVKLKDKKTLFYEQEKNISDLIRVLDSNKRDLEALTEKKKDFDLEKTQLEEQMSETEKEMTEEENKLLNQENNLELTKQRLTEFQSKISSEKDFKEQNIKELTELQVNISALSENIKSKREQLERAEAESKKYEQNIILGNEKIKELQILLEENKNSIGYINQEIIDLENEINVCNDNISKTEVEKVNINSIIEKKEIEMSKNNDDINAILKEKNRLELKKEQIDENRRNLFDLIWETYNITYQQALRFPKSELELNALYKRDNFLKNEIKQMGNVNVSAIEEYKEVSERYNFLKSQRDDIVLAEESLKELIAELTEMMSERFKSKFKIISDNFCSVFSEMFGGGKAYLNLSDESNVLESGIEIVAQPPGKRLQNLNLLSGGERALTAIALLFGILKMKPSPFCILDEIEAALDDSNVNRFAEYIKNFSDDTQFIVITHRKGTMEAADVLYGVTMQEQGISKLVSVELKNYETV